MQSELLQLISQLSAEPFAKQEPQIYSSLQTAINANDLQTYTNLLFVCLKHNCLDKYNDYFKDYATQIVGKIEDLPQKLENTNKLLEQTKLLGSKLTQDGVDAIVFGGLTTRLFNPNCVERPHGDIDFKVNANDLSSFLKHLDSVFKIDKVFDRRTGFSQTEDLASRSGKAGIPRVKTLVAHTQSGENIDLFLYTRHEDGIYRDFGVKPITNQDGQIEMRGFTRTNPNQDTNLVVDDVTTYSAEQIFCSKYSMISQGKALREKDFVDLYNLAQVVDYPAVEQTMQNNQAAQKGNFIEEPNGYNYLDKAGYAENGFQVVPFAIKHNDIVEVSVASSFAPAQTMQ